MVNRRMLSRSVAATLLVAVCIGVGVMVVDQSAGTSPSEENAPEESFTPESLLDAELTLPRGGMRLGEFGLLLKEQLGIYLASPVGVADRFVYLEPGTCTLRDALATVSASLSLTMEMLLDRDRVVVCFWRKPTARILMAQMVLAHSDDVVERCTGARWLERVGGRAALVQLLKMLADPNARVRHFAAKAVVDGWCGSDRFTIASLVSCVAPDGTGLVVTNALKTEQWRETRRNMFQIARGLRDPQTLPFLKAQLEKVDAEAPDGDTYSLYLTCSTIAEIGGPEAEAVLLAALDELPAKYERWAMRGLGKLGSDGAVARLGKLIDELQKSEHGTTPYFVASMLTLSDNPAAARALIRMLNRPGLQEREVGNVLELLARFNTPEAQAACLARLEAATDPGRWGELARIMKNVPAVRDAVFAEPAQGGKVTHDIALAFASTHDPRLVPVLTAFLVTAGPGFEGPMHVAVRALGRIGGPEAEKALIALATRDGASRRVALSALGYISTPAAREVLRAALSDTTLLIRSSAAYALSRRPDPADMDLLLASARKEQSKNTRDGVAWAIWNAVAKIGGRRAGDALVAEAAKGDAAAARMLVAATDPYCVASARDALTGDDAELRARLMSQFDTSNPVPLSAYYAVSVALTELAGADAILKRKRVVVLGWTQDPRATAALAELLVKGDAPQTVRYAAAEALFSGVGRSRPADPAAVESLRHALEHDPDDRVKGQAKKALMKWGVIPPEQPWRPRPPDRPDPEEPPDEREFPTPPDP